MVAIPEWNELFHDRFIELCDVLTRIADALDRAYPKPPSFDAPHSLEECVKCADWDANGGTLKIDHEPQPFETRHAEDAQENS